MTTENVVADHYSRDDLLTAITAALSELDKTPETISEEDLAPVGEFHVGGRPATIHLLEHAAFASEATVLDIGCGIGSTARLLAGRVASVIGIDLTEAYVETGNALNGWVELSDRVELHRGSALAMPYGDDSFDGAVMLHVGMNIEDKSGLFAEVARVLRSGSRFAIYDMMRISDGPLNFPMPWAADETTSFLAMPEDYRASAEAAGLQVVGEENRGAFATEFFKRLRAGGGPSPLGLQLLMGQNAKTKLGNLAAAIETGAYAPVELIMQVR